MADLQGIRGIKSDYDYAGYISKYGEPDQSKGQHLTDEFKLPNHITFSKGSKYSSDETPGGEWYEQGGKWNYKPSDYVLSQHPPEKLKKYFDRYEPDAKLVLPSEEPKELDLQGIKGIPEEPQLRKPLTYMDRLQGFKSKIFQDSVMEPGFIESLTAPMSDIIDEKTGRRIGLEGQPIDYSNIESVAGGRLREMFVDPIKQYADVMNRGLKGEIGRGNITIREQLAAISGQLDTTVGGLFQHTASKGFKGFDPNTLHMFVGPKASDIVKAEKMAMRGASPGEIQSKLLMHKKPDGFWRKEISDVEMALDQSKLEVKYPEYPEFEHAKVGDVVKHPELYEEAPGLKDLSFQLGQDISGVQERGSLTDNILSVYQDSPAKRIRESKSYAGSYTEEFIDEMAKELVESGDAPDYPTAKKWMEVARDKQIAKAKGIERFEPSVPGTVAHELQHAVQQKEGWARGGSPEMMSGRMGEAKFNLAETKQKLSQTENEAWDEAGLYIRKSGQSGEHKQYVDSAVDKWFNKLGEKSEDNPFGVDRQEAVQFQLLEDNPIYDSLARTSTKLGKESSGTPHEQYQNLLGEREARDTASRLGLSLEERRGSLPDVGEGATVLMRDGLQGLQASVPHSPKLYEISARSKEYSEMPISEVDRQAFGFAREDIQDISPKKLNVKYKDDIKQVYSEIKNSKLSEKEWAKTIDLSEPIQLSYEKGKFYIEDGHHRYQAAKILNKRLNVDDVNIKDKPHRTAIEKAISEGKTIPKEVLKDYPDLITRKVTNIST